MVKCHQIKGLNLFRVPKNMRFISDQKTILLRIFFVFLLNLVIAWTQITLVLFKEIGKNQHSTKKLGCFVNKQTNFFFNNGFNFLEIICRKSNFVFCKDRKEGDIFA